tara:strand:+ start:6180 stop:8159 length:1980 start_codon:yes stop_codon:yes gene_type:complete
MMRFNLTLVMIMFTITPIVAAGAPLPVKTGDHASFTRLVILANDGVEWEARRDSDKVIIRIESNTDGFDISEAFDRIGKGRMNAIIATDDTLEIGVNCDCYISNFLDSDRNIVIDISDAGTSILGRLLETHTPKLEVEVVDQEKEKRDRSLGTQEFPTVKATPDLASFQKRLLVNMGQLGTASILVPDKTIHGELDRQTAKIDPAKSRNIFEIENSNIFLPNFIERSVESRKADAKSKSCVKDKSLSFKMSVDNEFDLLSLPELAKFTDDAGNIDQRIATAYAKKLIGLGLGAEAKQAIELIKEKTTEVLILSVIGDILENGSSENMGLIEENDECISDLIFWNIIGGTKTDHISDEKLHKSLIYFNDLSSALRKYLFQPFLDGLNRLGRSDAVPVVLDTLARVKPSQSTEIKLEELRYQLNQNEPNEARNILDDIAAGSQIDTPKDFVSIMSAKSILKREVLESDIVKLESLIFEEANLEMRENLQEEKFFALISKGMFLDALNTLDEIGSPKNLFLYEDLIKSVTLNGIDSIVLEVTSAMSKRELNSIKPATKKLFEDRLEKIWLSKTPQFIIADPIEDGPIGVPPLSQRADSVTDGGVGAQQNDTDLVEGRGQGQTGLEETVSLMPEKETKSIGRAREILAESSLRRIELENYLNR